MACNRNYNEIQFPVEEKDFKKIEVQNSICINVFCYENEMVFIYLGFWSKIWKLYGLITFSWWW